MRKSAQKSFTFQKLRLNKHLKNSKAQMKRVRRRFLKLQPKYIKSVNHIESPVLRAFLNNISGRNGLTNYPYSISTPKNFSIFEQPEGSLLFIQRFIKSVLANPSQMTITHKKTTKWSVGSESLLGIVAREIDRTHEKSGVEFNLTGRVVNNDDYQDIINSVGIVSEMPDYEFNNPTKSDDNLIHAYKKNCSLNESSSMTAKDLKNETALEFVQHLTKCLNDHQLKLRESASDGLKGCIGEILDNVHEHCGLGTPNWFLRAYMNNSSSNKVLEISVFNVGKTFAQTFEGLDSSNFSKKIADKYVYKHKSNNLSKEALLTVAALQGNVSSKNHDKYETRGHGTITLIETFEKLFRDYKKLRQPNEKVKRNEPIMNLISGSTVIKFDGKYKSFKINDSGGGERVLFSFNDESDLALPPDSTYITSMKKGIFPGTIINIKVPLNGSVRTI